jgi:hypothetical protein
MYSHISPMKQILFTAILISISTIAIGCQQAAVPPTTKQPPATSPSPVAKVATTNANFDEPMYAFANPEITTLIKEGKYKSGLEHYTKVMIRLLALGRASTPT